MSPEIYHLIRRIQIHTTRLAQSLLAGSYRSAFKGKGMEFEEVRDYQPGDEIRSIDWKVTARMGHPYIKVFKEERQLTVMLVVDISASTRFGSNNMLKREFIAEIGALLAFSAIKNNDNVGLILFSDQVEKYIPPRTNLRHVLRIIRDLLLFVPKHSGTNVGEALAFLGKVEIKPGICFLLSDFLCPDFHRQAELIALKHDLIGVHIADPYEKQLPSWSSILVTDLETNQETLVNGTQESIKRNLYEAFQQQLETNKLLFHKLGAGFISLETDRPYVPIIQNFLKNRSRHF